MQLSKLGSLGTSSVTIDILTPPCRAAAGTCTVMCRDAASMLSSPHHVPQTLSLFNLLLPLNLLSRSLILLMIT